MKSLDVNDHDDTQGNRFAMCNVGRTFADEHADFWGPVSNFGIPLAAIADMSKDPEM